MTLPTNEATRCFCINKYHSPPVSEANREERNGRFFCHELHCTDDSLTGHLSVCTEELCMNGEASSMRSVPELNKAFQRLLVSCSGPCWITSFLASARPLETRDILKGYNIDLKHYIPAAQVLQHNLILFQPQLCNIPGNFSLHPWLFISTSSAI